MYLEIHVDRRRKNPYVYGLFRETFRDNGKVRHRTRGRVTGLSQRQLQAMREFVQRGCPEDSGHRYEIKDSREFGRQALIAKTREALETLARSRKRRTVEELGAAVGKILARWKVGKFFLWRVHNGKLEWELDQPRVATEESIDGCYVIRTDASEQVFDKNQAVACYRGLAAVERDFRQLKTVSIEIRPTYHQKDERIEAHVFLCLLAYYIQWHMHRRLMPLFEQDGQGAERRWTFAGVLERLKGIRQETLVFDQTEVTLKTTPDNEQQTILDLLDVRL